MGLCAVCCVCGCGHRIWFRLQPWDCVLCVWLWSQDMVQTPAMGLCAVCVAVVRGYGADSNHGAEVLCVWLWSQDMVQTPAMGLKCCVCGCGHRIWFRLQPWGWSALCVAVVTGYGLNSSHGAVCCVCGCGHRIWYRLQPWDCVLCVWLWSQDMVQTPTMGLCAVCGCGHRIWFRLQPWGCVLTDSYLACLVVSGWFTPPKEEGWVCAAWPGCCSPIPPASL